MYRAFLSLIAVGVLGSVAAASDINLTAIAQDNGTSNITVAPGASVPFRIEGLLNDDLNEGLALIGFDLHFTGGDLTGTTVDIPTGVVDCGNPMPNFVRNLGITNPDSPCPPQCGFAGTLVEGNLVQVGGGQNTINNTAMNADFPVGDVLPGIAQPSGCGTSVIATGTLTAPGEGGVYTLQIQDSFANIIRQGETGDPFWATDPAGVGTITNLTVTVESCPADAVALASSAPADQGSLWRSARNIIRLTFNNTLTEVPGITVHELLEGGNYGPDLSAGFSMELEGDTVVKLRETSTSGGPLEHRKWYAVRSDVDCDGVADFLQEFVVQVGDQDANRFVTAIDVGNINASPTGAVPDNSRNDIDGNGFRTSIDVGIANASQGGLPAKPTGH